MQYFESLLQEVNEETEREISSAVEKAVTLKLQKMQAKLDRCLKEKSILDDVGPTLLGLYKNFMSKGLNLKTAILFS